MDIINLIGEFTASKPKAVIYKKYVLQQLKWFNPLETFYDKQEGRKIAINRKRIRTYLSNFSRGWFHDTDFCNLVPDENNLLAIFINKQRINVIDVGQSTIEEFLEIINSPEALKLLNKNIICRMSLTHGIWVSRSMSKVRIITAIRDAPRFTKVYNTQQ
jgi:hypothetical protein